METNQAPEDSKPVMRPLDSDAQDRQHLLGWFSIRCLQPARRHNIRIRNVWGALAIGHRAMDMQLVRFLYTMGWASNSDVRRD